MYLEGWQINRGGIGMADHILWASTKDVEVFGLVPAIILQIIHERMRDKKRQLLDQFTPETIPSADNCYKQGYFWAYMTQATMAERIGVGDKEYNDAFQKLADLRVIVCQNRVAWPNQYWRIDYEVYRALFSQVHKDISLEEEETLYGYTELPDRPMGKNEE